jgi:nanoRNase/pAp phosphatase (c-di-AMP/oligoRNAs hydrolase)
MDNLYNLRDTLDGYSELLIIPHNDPDPDAIAAAMGLRYLVATQFGIDARIRYRGIIGRAENKALVRYLKKPLRMLDYKELSTGIPVALVDTQPGAGNNPLPKEIQATVVIDHHTWRNASSNALFIDVRPDIGASSTILTEYLQAESLEIPANLATALFYGIKTDTMGLARGASFTDTAAYFFLQPKIDVEALVQIERAQVPATYFKSLAAALQTARLYDDDLVISDIGYMRYPDLSAEIADLLLRLHGVKWVICVGVYRANLLISVRSRSRKIGAGNIVQSIVGNLGSAGGHGTMAAGHIPLRNKNTSQLVDELCRKALIILKDSDSLDGTALI